MANFIRNKDRSGNKSNLLGSFSCDDCGNELRIYRGSLREPVCKCGAHYSFSGQRLRDDWKGNPSAGDEEIGDLEGYEMQHSGD